LTIDTASYRPRAVIELRSDLNLRLVARPRETMAPDRSSPCGAYDEVGNDGPQLLFSWSICGDDAVTSEFVVAFDVVDGAGEVVAKERLPFQLARDGIYWASDSL
jgi:hypothetical protein